jgi:hypothetical protein
MRCEVRPALLSEGGSRSARGSMTLTLAEAGARPLSHLAPHTSHLTPHTSHLAPHTNTCNQIDPFATHPG